MVDVGTKHFHVMYKCHNRGLHTGPLPSEAREGPEFTGGFRRDRSPSFSLKVTELSMKKRGGPSWWKELLGSRGLQKLRPDLVLRLSLTSQSHCAPSGDGVMRREKSREAGRQREGC